MHEATATHSHVSLALARLRCDAHPSALRLVEPHEQARVERFICDAYAAAYGAHLTEFMPHLAAVECCDVLVAACGLRPAAHGRLFLEAYLDEPVERALSAASASHIERNEIVEIGNLAIAQPGAARILITRLTEYLTGSSENWVVFTAVTTLRNSFRRMGIALYELADARHERVGPDALRQWGAYYENGPRVVGVRISQAAAALGLSR